MKNRMKDEKIIINVNGSVSMEEGNDSVIGDVWFTSRKNNNKVYNTGKFLFKAIKCGLYTSTEIIDNEFRTQYF